MPEWLLSNDNYEPLKDNHKFIDKSIISILRILSRFRINSKAKESKFSINPAIKVFWMVIQIILIALNHNILYLAFIGTSLLLLISLLSLYEIRNILRTVITAVLFAVFILIPSMVMGNLYNSSIMIIRIGISTAVVSLIAYTTVWRDLTSTLKLFFIPDIFILVMDITIKYIFLLGELALDMFHALKLKSVGRSDSKNSSISAIIGTIFIKSKEMAEDMQDAMECRGFNGEYTQYRQYRVSLKDFIFIIYIVLSLLFYIRLR